MGLFYDPLTLDWAVSGAEAIHLPNLPSLALASYNYNYLARKTYY